MTENTKTQKTQKHSSGQAAIAAVILFFSVSLIIGGNMAASAMRQTAGSRTVKLSLQSLAAAESGVEDALYRLKTGKRAPAEIILTVGEASVVTSVSTTLGAKIVVGDAAAGATKRKVQAVVSNLAGLDFVYGTQIGMGGIEMGNNSRIEGVGGAVGNVVSAGPIEGDNGAVITGTVITSSTLDDLVVYGHAHARDIGEDAKICGNAFFQTIDDDALSFLNNPSGSICPAPATPGMAYPNQPPTSTSALPVSDAFLASWKKDAGCGQMPAAAPCLYSGTYQVTNNVSMGPKTITGDLLLNTGNKTLTVDGTIYVQGNIDISGNGASIKCMASYGANSCVVLTDGTIHVQNNGAFAGSGAPGSYVLLFSAAACDGTATTTPPCASAHHNGAIDLHNNATGAIFYASRGMVNLHNNVSVKEVVGYKLRLDNNAVVSYETGLIDTLFSTGPGGAWTVTDWREIE